MNDNCTVNDLRQVTGWDRALRAARQTAGKTTPEGKTPSQKWEAQMLLAEHSPIRLVEYEWRWEKIKQWVSVHLTRHHEGCEKFVSTQRQDRNANITDRDSLPQGSENTMMMTANAQALMNISRKRLCSCASPETRHAWSLVKDEIRKTDPVMADKMVRECVYRGFCPEWRGGCGYDKTQAFQDELRRYRCTDYLPDGTPQESQ